MPTARLTAASSKATAPTVEPIFLVTPDTNCLTLAKTIVHNVDCCSQTHSSGKAAMLAITEETTAGKKAFARIRDCPGKGWGCVSRLLLCFCFCSGYRTASANQIATCFSNRVITSLITKQPIGNCSKRPEPKLLQRSSERSQECMDFVEADFVHMRGGCMHVQPYG